MSLFSEQLNAVILKKRLSLPELAERSGLTTALISKIKTGKRLPDSEDKIFSLIQALHCTLEQETNLLNEYRIEKYGRNRYLCMQECHRCIEMLVTYPSLPVLNQISGETLSFEQGCIVGEVNINNIVHSMVDYEIRQPKGCLRISMRPSNHFDASYLLDIFSSTALANFQIDHIIPLHDSTFIDDSDNVHLAAQCLRIAHYCGNNYHPFYYYKSDFTSAFFPFCILTSSHALLINTEHHTALYFSDENTLTALHKMFDALISRCHPFLLLNGTTHSYLKYYETLFASLHGSPLETMQLSYAPSLLSVIPQQVAMKHIHPTLRANNYTTNFLMNYWRNIKYEHVKTIFHLSGLDLFMQTGKCHELPYESESCFTPTERATILRLFMEHCDAGQIIPIILKENSLKLAPELSIKTVNRQTPLFFWNPVKAPFSSCTLEENTIRENFASFMDYIQETSSYTYSPAESLELLHVHVERYFH